MMEYIDMHPDLNDQNYDFIVHGIQLKLDAMLRRTLYTLYKTSDSETVREYARNAYLDEIGVPSAFRWNSDFEE